MNEPKQEDIKRFFYNTTAFNTSRNSRKHYHSLYEIYYLEEGECHYLIEGKLFEMVKGDMVFIPKGMIHKTTYSGVHSRLLINCPDTYLENAELKEAYVYRNEQHSREIHGIFNNIEKEYLKNDQFSDALIKGYMQQLLAIVYRTENQYQNTGQQNPYVKSVLDFLKEDFTQDVTLGSLADKFGISAEHLSRIFKKETGLGFNEYISLLRLKKAEALLKKNEDMSISDIAFSSGFNDSNYFCEKFKKVYGISPLKFRKKINL